MRANIACGAELITRFAWVNVDLVPSSPEVKKGDLCALPFEDASLDEVVCSHALEHLERPQDAIAEGWRVLKPGGFYLAAVPDARYTSHWLSSYLMNLHAFGYSEEQKHRQDFTALSLAACFQESARWSSVEIVDPRDYWELPGKGLWQACVKAAK